jgi:hypothetical protein
MLGKPFGICLDFEDSEAPTSTAVVISLSVILSVTYAF